MGEILKISVVEITGSDLCTAADDGQKVFELISKGFTEGKKVDISFKKVQDMTSAFLNTAIGQLYGKFSEAEIKENLTLSDAKNDDLVLIKRVVDRAKDFFKNPEAYKDAVKKVIGS